MNNAGKPIKKSGKMVITFQKVFDRVKIEKLLVKTADQPVGIKKRLQKNKENFEEFFKKQTVEKNSTIISK